MVVFKATGKSSAQAKYEHELRECIDKRKQAYLSEADGLFFDYQRGENTKEEWENKIAEIKARFPKPEIKTTI